MFLSKDDAEESNVSGVSNPEGNIANSEHSHVDWHAQLNALAPS